MGRADRLKAIKEIIKNNKISSQEELINKLKQNGYLVTQSTVSRDLSQLRLSKIRNFKQEEYYTLESKYYGNMLLDVEKLKSKFKQSVISTDIANNIIVIKTYPGEAQGTAAVLDGMNFVEILGTVAGDDTIICIVDNEDNAKEILSLLKNYE